MDPTRTLVLYYSRSGYTRRAAQDLARHLEGATAEFRTRRYGFPALGVLRALFDVVIKASPEPQAPLPDLRNAGLVVLAGPVWAGKPAAPLRRMLGLGSVLPADVGLLLTSGEPSEPKNTYAACEALLGRPFAATAFIGNKIDGTDEMGERLAAFAALLRQRSSDAAE
ncbi:flavodoxin family protein [Pontivivens ytuae]|uniref:Flavodoxin n=1 Tax=Pontivivens ytuae TaxID=2789856 RepID=A0A7S9LQ72_9RHOB|nr:hypothetical protein [Pontivivens ytuae]QPH52945.1 hypothetical protein I0K15_14165 [Pontivivens ytuae]